MATAAFETSTRSPSVALKSGGVLLEERLSGARPHASDLLPALDRLLSKAGGGIADLELLVVGTGPGSFTGLRVATATALGIARGCKAALLGIPSGEAQCWRELAVGEEAAWVADARQSTYYFAHYRRLESGIEVLKAPCLIRPAELAALVGLKLRIFAEPGLDLSTTLGAGVQTRLTQGTLPSAAALLELGMLRLGREGSHSAAQLEPLYLRTFASPPN